MVLRPSDPLIAEVCTRVTRAFREFGDEEARLTQSFNEEFRSRRRNVTRERLHARLAQTTAERSEAAALRFVLEASSNVPALQQHRIEMYCASTGPLHEAAIRDYANFEDVTERDILTRFAAGLP